MRARRCRGLTLTLGLAACLRQNPDFDGAATASASAGGSGSGGTGGSTGTSSLVSEVTGSASATTGGTGGTGAGSGGSTGGAADLGGGATTGGAGCPGLNPAALGIPEAVAELNSAVADYDPWLTADGRTIFFASERGGTGADSYRAERTGPGAPFDVPVSNTDLNINTPDGETKVVLTDDGLGYVVGAVINLKASLFTATRGDVSEPFGPRTPLILPPQDVAPMDVWMLDPHLGAGRLYASPSPGTQRLAMWEGAGETYAPPALDVFTEIHKLGGSFADPTLSSDERTLVFTLTLMDAEDSDLWFSTRDSVDQPFKEPQELAGLNTDESEGNAHLSRDGCELFFTRTAVDLYAHDIYRAALGS